MIIIAETFAIIVLRLKMMLYKCLQSENQTILRKKMTDL